MASDDLDAASSRIDELIAAVGDSVPPQEDLEAIVTERKLLLEEWASIFSLGGYELSIVGDNVGSVDLDITPGVAYDFTVRHTGSPRHYKLGIDDPNLAIGHKQVRYLEHFVQEWTIRVAAGETVHLEIATDSEDDRNEGAPQATEIGLTIINADTEAVVLGPTSTALSLNTPTLFTLPSTTTARDLRVKLEPNQGHFRIRKVGGDESFYLLPCPIQEGVAAESAGFSCLIGIFEDDDTHDWTLRWTTSTPPEAGEARLKLAASTVEPSEAGSMTETDQLLDILFEIAGLTDVALNSVKVLREQAVSDDLLRYQTQSLELNLTGETHSGIYDYLEKLHQRVPAVGISGFDMAGFTPGETPSAKVRVSFYLAPRRASAP